MGTFNIKVILKTEADAGTQSFLASSTYVDIAPATSAASTYEVRVIVTAETNIITFPAPV